MPVIEPVTQDPLEYADSVYELYLNEFKVERATIELKERDNAIKEIKKFKL